MRSPRLILSSILAAACLCAEDARLGPLKDLNGYFPFDPPKSAKEWRVQQEKIRRRILVSQGLVTSEQLEQVLREQSRSGERLERARDVERHDPYGTKQPLRGCFRRRTGATTVGQTISPDDAERAEAA